MKLRMVSVLVCAALLSSMFLTIDDGSIIASPQHGFKIQEYEEFHDVLHPLEHEALPRNDFKRIRAKSGELVQRGRAIVRLGVPPGTADDKKEEFTQELKKFDAALTKFRSDARRGSNEQLKTSYSAEHDSFEMLAALIR